MAEVCRILEQAAPEPEKASEGFGRTKERFSPVRMVRISGKDLADEYLDDKITSVTVEETARGLSKARVVVQNVDLKFTDHELLAGGNLEVEVFTGYSNTKFVKRGTFHSAVPRYAFRNRAMPQVVLECFSEEWPMAVSERRTVYENLSDSEIAAKLAKQYGFDTDIQDTSPRYEHVAQFNVTDFEFLESRALLYGYDVYVSEKVLHFHEPRFQHSSLTLFYGSGEKGILTSFEVVVDPWVSGAAWTKSGINRITGEEYEYRTTSELDPVATAIQKSGGAGFKLGSALSQINNAQPKRFIVGDGHEMTEGEARQQVRGYARASEWVVVGSGTVRGIELLKARQVVTVSGIGHLAGDYYVAGVTHHYDKRGYSMSFKLMRPGVGRLEDKFQSSRPGHDNRRDATAESEQLGEAEVVSG